MSNQSVMEALDGLIKQNLDVRDQAAAAAEVIRSAEREQLRALVAGIEAQIKNLAAQRAEVERHSLPGAVPMDAKGKGFSMARAVLAISRRDWSGAGYEQEVFKEQAKRLAASSGVDSAGGFLVPDNVVPGLIERLTAEMVVMALGAREIDPGPVSPLIFNKRTTGSTVTWLTGEGSTIPPSTPGLGQISMSPKSAAALTTVSNQLLELSPTAAEAWINAEMALDIALAVDKAALEGTGASGQPVGIIREADIGTSGVSGTVTYAELVDMTVALMANNGYRGKLGWALHPLMFAQVMKVKSENDGASTTPVLQVARNVVSDGPMTSILGLPYRTTTAFTATTDADSIILGNWDDLIVANWGGIRLASTDQGSTFATDETQIRAIRRVDVRARQPKSFVVAT